MFLFIIISKIRQLKTGCTRCSAPAVADERDPSASRARWPERREGENSGEPELTVGDPFRRIKRLYTLYGSRRT